MDEFEQTQKDSEEQGSLACCSLWGRKELDMTEQLNWTDPAFQASLAEESAFSPQYILAFFVKD